MARRIRAIVYGVGITGSRVARVMIQKGIEIVGAIDVDPSKVGKDLGEVIGLGRPLNVIISDDADAVLREREADIVFVVVGTEMEPMYPIFVKCIENGLNILTSAEEAVYPWTIAPELASKLDKLAKKHGVTITGGGNPDVTFIRLPSLMTACCVSIESIIGRIVNDLNTVGPEFSKLYHVGKTKDEFYQREKKEKVFHIFRPMFESLIADLDLTIKNIETRQDPVIANEDVEWKPGGTIIKSGLVTGMSDIIEISTEQGINFRGEYTGKLFRRREKVPAREWVIKGEPDFYVNYSSPGMPEVIRSAIFVHRIPDVINSEPGYITIENYPTLKFRQLPLHCYLKK